MNKFFLDLIDKIKQMETKYIIIIAAIFICLVCLVLILITSTPDKEQKMPTIDYELEYPIELPEEPGYMLEYKFSRQPQKKWEREEVVEHFTLPEGENLERLSSANEKLILDILEAAP